MDGALENFRKRSRREFVCDGCFSVRKRLLLRQNLPDEIGVGIFRVKDRADFVGFGNVFERLVNLVALAATRNAVVDDLGWLMGGVGGEKVGGGKLFIWGAYKFG